MKTFVKDYLTFTKKERIGIITLLILVLLVTFIPLAFSYFVKQTPQNTKDFENEIAALQIKQLDSNKKFAYKNYDESNYQNYYQPSEKNYKNYKIKGELFYFDPNTISTADWQRLGVREKTIATIENYLSKGGKFYNPEDLGKIWGFFPNEIERLNPYVQIDKTKLTAQNNYPQQTYPTQTYEKKTYTPSTLDVNTADTTAFIALPGIGSKLAQRIITFREKLGGFYKIEQVGETFGLPDSTYQKIKNRFTLSSVAVKKININTATIEEFKLHPYIRYNLGNAIIQYRIQHGNYTGVDGIKKIMICTEEMFGKAAPYLIAE